MHCCHEMATKHGTVQLASIQATRCFTFNCNGNCLSVDDLLRSCKDGPLHNAVDALNALHHRKHSVSMELLICLVEKCAKEKNLALARCLHLLLSNKKSNPRTLLADHLIRMYTSCGSLADANRVFLNTFKPSIFTWNAIILAYAKLGDGHMAIELYCKMHVGGALKPDKYVIALILKVCSNIGDMDHGRLVHHQIVSMKISSDIFLDNDLVFMYVKGGSLDDAQSVFDSLKTRNIVTWSVLIEGCAQYGRSALALEAFQEMQNQGVQVDKVVFLCVLKACSCICQGMYIHNQVVKHNLESDVVVASAIVNMYTKCSGLQEACNVFERVRAKDTILWSSIIAGCIDLEQNNLALELFQRMSSERTEPNDFTFSCVIKACGNARALEQGRIIHDMRVRTGSVLDVIVGNTLIDMYAQCGAIEEALRIFEQLTSKSIVTWGTIIGVCADSGCSGTALRFFNNFEENRLVPDSVIFLSVLKACINTGNLLQGRQIHNSIIKHGLSGEINIGNTLVDLYLKCHNMEEARKVFDGLPSQSCVSWTAMLRGYIQQQQWTMALDLFGNSSTADLKLDSVIFLYALEACGNAGLIRQGMLIHDQIIRHGFESEKVIGGALLDAYCKCGHLHEGYRVFDRLLCKDMVTWGAMIGGLVHGGNWSLARKCLLEMRQLGISPSLEIYTCILIACSSAGLVEEGRWYYNLMKEEHGDIAKIDHLSCMVDLFGRVGCLRESEDFVNTIPILPNEISWTSLLTSCKTYHNVQLGNVSFNEQIEE